MTLQQEGLRTGSVSNPIEFLSQFTDILNLDTGGRPTDYSDGIDSKIKFEAFINDLLTTPGVFQLGFCPPREVGHITGLAHVDTDDGPVYRFFDPNQGFLETSNFETFKDLLWKLTEPYITDLGRTTFAAMGFDVPY